MNMRGGKMSYARILSILCYILMIVFDLIIAFMCHNVAYSLFGGMIVLGFTAVFCILLEKK